MTPEEYEVVEALKIIGFLESNDWLFLGKGSAPTKILLKLDGIEQRIPLEPSEVGSGVCFALVLNLFSARGAFLLVDEIDIGLHHRIIEEVPRL